MTNNKTMAEKYERIFKQMEIFVNTSLSNVEDDLTDGGEAAFIIRQYLFSATSFFCELQKLSIAESVQVYEMLLQGLLGDETPDHAKKVALKACKMAGTQTGKRVMREAYDTLKKYGNGDKSSLSRLKEILQEVKDNKGGWFPESQSIIDRVAPKTTDYTVANNFKTDYPNTHNALTWLVPAMDKYYRNHDKKSFFGKNIGEELLSKVIVCLGRTIDSMVADGLIQRNISTSECKAILIQQIGHFRSAYPNWQAGYAFAEGFLVNNAEASEGILTNLLSHE